MSLIKTLIIGRENGIRQSLLRSVLGGSSESTGPATESSPPAGETALNLGVEPPKDVIPPEGFEVVLHVDALPPGTTIEVIIAGKAIAVSNVDGTFFACSNTCPHAEGPLGEGSLDGYILTCPYHGWEFDVRDGAYQTQVGVGVQKYAVEIVDDAVCVAV